MFGSRARRFSKLVVENIVESSDLQSSGFLDSSATISSLSNTNISSLSAGDVLQYNGSNWVNNGLLSIETMTVALSDESTAITTGSSKLVMRAPHAMTLTSNPRAYLSTQSSSGLVTVDINVSGSSILSTKLTIDANEKTSVTAATQPVLSNTSISDDSEITFDIDSAGTGAKGLKITLFYKRS